MGAIQISFEFGMSFEHCQLGVYMWDKGKVPGWSKKSSLLHPRCLYGSGTLIGINFDPQTAENTGPPFLAILDVENCSKFFIDNM